MSDEDNSSKDFIYEPKDRIPMTAGQAHKDQFQQFKTRKQV